MRKEKDVDSQKKLKRMKREMRLAKREDNDRITSMSWGRVKIELGLSYRFYRLFYFNF